MGRIFAVCVNSFKMKKILSKSNFGTTPNTKASVLKTLVQVLIGGWFVLLILVIRPIVKVYFAPLATSRIGHFILDTEILLLIIKSENTSQRVRKVVFWIPDKLISNDFVYQIWSKNLKIIKSNRLTHSIYTSALVFEKLTKIKLTYRFKSWDGYLPFLHKLETENISFSISKEDEQECLETLKDQGIDTARPWVCLLARDEEYLNTSQPNLLWTFNSYRNSNIDTYLRAAEWLASKKVITFRMGVHVQKPFLSNNNPFIIDYATGGWRTEKMDIFLAMKCLFFLSTSTGLDAVAIATRKPLLVVNLAQPLTGLRTKSNHIFILKKFYSKSTKSFIGINKYLNIGLSGGFSVDNPRHLRGQDFERFDIEVIDNSSDEILGATQEMFQLVSKLPLTTPLSINQRRYWIKFPFYNTLDVHGQPKSRIGKKFIDQNLWLLD